ncbi:MAG: hypothetical protein QXV17_01390 [Candidatus Micrarchaeaceae archaeon]
MIFNSIYERTQFVEFLKSFLPNDFKYEEIKIENTDKQINSTFLGRSQLLNLSVYEIEYKGSRNNLSK